MDPLEKLLSDWTPRPPSPALRTALFGRSPARTRTSASWFQFAPPAMAAAALALALTLHPDRLGNAVRQAGAWTNAVALLAHSSSAQQCANNALPVAGFAWTNAALAPSTNASAGGL